MAKPPSLSDLLSSATKASGQYRTYGGLDDKAIDDQDIQFSSINQRLQLNQLGPTEVRESINGRMEGYWKPRKSVVLKSSGLAGSGTPLRIPFYLIDPPLSITAAALVGSTVTITVTHGFAASTTGWAKVSGITGFTGTNPNGIFLLSYDTSSTLKYSLIGSSGTYGVTSALLSAAPINNSVSTIYGSCLFSDPSSNNDESILIATGSSVKRVKLSNFTTTDILYPNGDSITNTVEMLQCFEKVIMFRNGQQSLQWADKTSTKFYRSPAGVFTQPAVFTPSSVTLVAGLFTVRANPRTLNCTVITSASANTIVLPEFWDDGTKVSTTNDYYFDGTLATMLIDSVSRTITDYNGATRTLTISGLAIAAGTHTLSISTHGMEVGDIVVVSGLSDIDGLNIGDEFIVGVVNSVHEFTFYANVKHVGSITLILGRVQSSGIGFMFQPAAPWGEYFQRRLWVPFKYSQTGTYSTPVITDRLVRDEIAVSDILDSDTFDQIYGQFKISGGTADYLVGMHGFYDDAMIVFNRNSIHRISQTGGAVSDTIVKELTSEVGCLARKSIVMQGNTLLFLSDNGVYALEFMNDYNLRGTEQPLSKNIQPYIDRINSNLADKSVAVYHDNRYWLAVPLDSAAGANDASGNNAMLVFNFLNGGWESVDTYNDPRFNIMNLHVAKGGVRNDLYIVTGNGGIHRVDDSEGSIDIVSIDTSSATPVSMPITSSLTTRGYDMGDMGRKRFSDIQVQMQALPSDSSAAFDISFSAEDPDNASYIGSTEDMIGEPLKLSDTANVRARIGGVRGYTGTVILKRTKGSPKLHSVKLSSTITNRSIISQN